MSYYEIPLTADTPTNLRVGGKLILIDTISGADSVDIRPVLNGSERNLMRSRRPGFKVWVEFDEVVLTASDDCTVTLFLSDKDVSLGFANGSNINVQGSVTVTNDSGNPVPVDLITGSVELTATNVGINNNLTVITNLGPVTIGVVASVLVADATQKRLRIRNTDAAARVGLGGAGVTLANAAIILEPGEMWIESDAPGATWYAISDTADTDMAVQGLK